MSLIRHDARFYVRLLFAFRMDGMELKGYFTNFGLNPSKYLFDDRPGKANQRLHFVPG
jgi:hypothetical protein